MSSLRPLAFVAQNRFVDMVARVKQSAHIEEIDVPELQQMLDAHPAASSADVHVVDVRESAEHAQGTIPGAICLPRGIVDRDIERYIPADTTDKVVLVCAGGVRSIMAAESLKRMGFANVLSLRGGMRGWQMQGMPIEKQQK
ncbi:Rhodanese-like domain-containing protein [Thamnocephalis sphaerospora]|uniref:Rhodanese-like domain-containing protein n=1 Tax=Thamnocephalis sphaerospora TaxID=78915 RepID=A0A4P9XI64_9FUNG|nr:Rhodanese-like domain-containing protein [Thamnocephalis sphaerospora]|eukprot:RKP05368.1 Rhodanese-like domain-containing protein [Thamnocephalis sphaerospora]